MTTFRRITGPLVFGDVIAYAIKWPKGHQTEDRNIYLGRDREDRHFSVLEIQTAKGDASSEVMTWANSDQRRFRRVVEDDPE